MLFALPRASPFARGLPAVHREPAVLRGEIGWRWLFGGIAAFLLIWAMLTFLHSVQASRAKRVPAQDAQP